MGGRHYETYQGISRRRARGRPAVTKRHNARVSQRLKGLLSLPEHKDTEFSDVDMGEISSAEVRSCVDNGFYTILLLAHRLL